MKGNAIVKADDIYPEIVLGENGQCWYARIDSRWHYIDQSESPSFRRWVWADRPVSHLLDEFIKMQQTVSDQAQTIVNQARLIVDAAAVIGKMTDGA